MILYLSIYLFSKKTLEKANRNLVDPLSLLEMDEEEKLKMKEIQECIQNIEETVKCLEG